MLSENGFLKETRFLWGSILSSAIAFLIVGINAV